MAVYTANLEYTGKAYAFAGGRSHQAFETTIVVLSTDTVLEGYGEVCPCGPNYMAAFAEDLPSCLSLLAPEILGQDPRQVSVIQERINQVLTGTHDTHEPQTGALRLGSERSLCDQNKLPNSLKQKQAFAAIKIPTEPLSLPSKLARLKPSKPGL